MKFSVLLATLPLTAVLVIGHQAMALKKADHNKVKVELDDEDIASLKAPPQKINIPTFEEMGIKSPEMVKKAESSESSHADRAIASARSSGSEDLMSPELKKFRVALLAVRDGYSFNELLSKYDNMYDRGQIPDSANDLKYVVARLSTMRAFGGIVWRMIPIVHRVVVTQEALLAMMRNTTENIFSHDNSHLIEAQMAFFSMPQKIPAREDRSKEVLPDQFKYESDLMTFFTSDFYPVMTKAIHRLENLKMKNVTKNGEEPITFDAQLRFGEGSFRNSTYNASDRYKILTDAEKFVVISRYHQRLAVIDENVAYNWNGYISLTKKIGAEYGIGGEVIRSAIGDKDAKVELVAGLTREARVGFTKSGHFANLWTLVPNGGEAMKRAYQHFQMHVYYMNEAWKLLRVDANAQYYTQVDPEFFQGRKELIQQGMENLLRLTAGSIDHPGNAVPIHGAISTDVVNVNLAKFYSDPPHDLKALLPTAFEREEMVKNLKLRFKDAEFDPANPDRVTFTYEGHKVWFRNYAYGRGKVWSSSAPNGYGNLFPGLSDNQIIKARQVLGEARGTRFLTNAVMLTIR